MTINNPNDDLAPVNRLTDKIMENGKLLEQAVPPALTPAKVEALMARFYASSPETHKMASFVRPPDAEVDPGVEDLSVLAQCILQCTRAGGPEGQGITMMYAAYGLWCYYNAKVKGGVV